MPKPASAPICVTGATGYVAGHVVRELLERGHTVHATARDPSNEAKVGHLKALGDELPGTLVLFAADLLEPGSFDQAIAGCSVVVHTASPFVIGSKDPQKTLIEPALQGTENVLASVEAASSVTRVVLTSSVVALYADPADCAAAGGVLDESHWNETATLDYQPYALSKTVAERRAWELHAAQDRWELVTINPGFVMGPSLTARNDSTSIDFLLALMDGRRASGMWESQTGWVDVRDVAIAHAEAAERPDAEGRHILVAETTGYWTVIDYLKEDAPVPIKPPGMKVPKWLAYVLGPLNGFSWRYVSTHVGTPLAFDNTRSRERLGIAYRPLRDTIREHVEQLVADGLYTAP